MTGKTCATSAFIVSTQFIDYTQKKKLLFSIKLKSENTWCTLFIFFSRKTENILCTLLMSRVLNFFHSPKRLLRYKILFGIHLKRKKTEKNKKEKKRKEKCLCGSVWSQDHTKISYPIHDQFF